jgi:manganese transport protein
LAKGHSVDAKSVSLPEVNDSVSTSHPRFWRQLLAFGGPAYLVSVGYMDPGNWATDLEGGARFGYHLLWVLVLSNAMALLLQTLSARLGIVTKRDLAQACRDEYPKPVAMVLWILCEIAIVACDLAEVLGAAIGLNLLFHIPMLIGVLVTAADTLLVLWFTRLGIRVIEAFVLVLIATIGGCFAVEIFLAKPDSAAVFAGLLPRLNTHSIYLAVAIFGATVMPHNLYLHSALVQTRRIGNSEAERRRACKFNLLDSTFALNGALFVNAAILIMSAALFFSRHIIVTEIQQAHQLLSPLLGTAMASFLFAVALLCSGQSSTLTGTMAGQIVMEGFLRFRMQPWLRRFVTRSLAIIPAALTIYYAGAASTLQLIVFSQIVLTMQLPFAVIPLVHLTSDKKSMGAFANGIWLKAAAWTCAAFILVLDVWMTIDQVMEWIHAAPAVYRLPIAVTAGLAGVGFAMLLGAVTFWPWIGGTYKKSARVALEREAGATLTLRTPTYSRVLVPLDHSAADEEAVSNACALARMYGASIILLHVEEGVTSQMFGSLSSTAEITEGQDYLAQIVASLNAQKVPVSVVVRHGKSPAHEIAEAVKELQPDLLVMASHGHSGIKDLIFGTTINEVRHKVKVPMMIVSKT